jgi:Flp pilus assembly protein TadD
MKIGKEGEKIEPGSKEKGIPYLLFTRYGTAIAFLLITVTALIIYSNTLFSPFQLDDTLNIVKNSKLRDFRNFWPPSGTRYIGFLSFAVNYHFGELDVFGYHLINTIIHIVNGLLVWSLVLLTFKTPVTERAAINLELKNFIALTAALIFISHPIQTQAVTYISQRITSLATLFYLLGVVLYIKARLTPVVESQGSRVKTKVFCLGALLSTLLAMKTKEISFTLPLIIVLYEFTFFNNKTRFITRLFYLAPFLFTLPIIPLTLFAPELGLAERGYYVEEVIRSSQIRDLTAISPHDYLMTQFRVIFTYLRLLILPVGQHMNYDYPMFHSILEPQVLLSVLFLSVFLGSTVYLFVRSRTTDNTTGLLISFGIFWFFITISVESSIIPIKDVIFEHRLYLPSVGIIVAITATLSCGFDIVWKRFDIKWSEWRRAWALIIVIVFSITAHMRNNVWGDELGFLLDEVRKSPNKASVHGALGLAYYHRDQTDKAIHELQTATKLKPDSIEDHINLGAAYYKQGRIDKLIEEYKIVLRLEPDSPAIHNDLGIAYYELGRIDEAIEEFQLALRLEPDRPDAHYNLGIAYYSKGRIDEAIKEYTEALGLVPSNADAHYNLGLAYMKKGLNKEATKEFEEVLKLKPQDAEARKALQSLSR